MAKKVLIVDDDPLIVRMYERVFGFEKVDVITALLPADGLAKASATKPDLILLDIMMPDMDGLEVLRRLKADDATKVIPVIVLTNLSDDARAKEAMKLGAVSVMVKSDYSPKQVVDKVNAAMSGK